MKHFTARLAIVLLLFSTWPVAAGPQGEVSDTDPTFSILRRDAQGLPTWITGKLGTLEGPDLARSAAARLPELVARHLGGSGREELVERRSSVDSGGRLHVRFQQTLRGLPVVGAELIVHIEQATGEIVGVNGRFARDEGLSTEPTLAAGEALDMARRQAGVGSGSRLDDPELTYVLHPDTGRAHLAWAANVRYESPEGKLADRLFADANDGSLVLSMPQQLFAKRRNTYTANNDTDLPGTLLISDDEPKLPPPNDPDAETVHDHAGLVYDFHASSFGRDGIDGNGGIIRSSVHYGNNVDLARYQLVWNDGVREDVIWYGDGDSDFLPLGRALDVVAHEMQHGVTIYDVGLPFEGESNALHEALSDVFGAAAEAWVDGGVNSNTWKIAEDVYLGGSALRFMDDPALDGHSIDFLPELDLSLSPNDNAGILNLAFYLLVEGGTHPRGKTTINVSGIGMSSAQRIFYDAMSYLGGNIDFEDMRQAALSAAAAAYGMGSGQYQSTNDAFCAVGYECEDTSVAVSFPAVADAWVDQRAPNANHGSSQILRVRSAATGYGLHTYTKFSVFGVTGPVQSARLKIRTHTQDFTGSRIYHMVSSSWAENTITWNNAPLAFHTQWALGPLDANTWYEFDVTSLIGGNGVYTLGLVAYDEPNLAFRSRESPYKPELIVTYQQ
ncbi:MAG: M4 family metallopeptidase [bacterium]|nr:M4 family metallopeptidase [bacterium]